MRSEVAGWRARDGLTMLTRHWRPAGDAWATVLLVHGIAEHSGRWEHVGSRLARAGLDVHAFDLRGNGGSGGRRGYVERWERYLDDVEDRLAASRAPGLPAALYGHSLGALVALGYALSERPAPDLLVLSAPAIDARVPPYQRVLAPIFSRVAPTLAIPSPIDGAQLSRDPAVGTAYFADPLVVTRTTGRLGGELMLAMAAARRDLARLAVPTLVVHGSEDTLVPAHVSEPLGRLPGVDRRVYPDLRHELHNEPEGPAVLADIVAWLRERVGPQVVARPGLTA